MTKESWEGVSVGSLTDEKGLKALQEVRYVELIFKFCWF